MARHRRPAHSVAAAYDIASDGSIGFALGQYDPAFALTIDPILTYSTYLGSGTSLDQPFDIAVDTNGKAYIAGATESSLFPPVNYYDNTYNGGCDAFVASFDLNTTGIGSFVYSSYFGGSSTDQAEGIAVNTSGSSAWVSITGWTYSSDFPVPGAAPLQIGLSGPGDAFVARFYPVDGGHLNLTPAYSAYLGGSAYDWGYDIAVDTNGRAYVTGLTYSSDFPTVPFQTATTPTDDVFVSKVFPEYEQQCHWPHTIGATDTRNYDWGPQLATPGTAWRNAFQTAIQSWNSAGTNFVLFENAALSNITMDLYTEINGPSGSTDISCSGSMIIHTLVKVNTAVVLSPVVEVPAHEIGHGQGLGHIARDGVIMRYDTGGVTGPQAQDVELHRLLYP